MTQDRTEVTELRQPDLYERSEYLIAEMESQARRLLDHLRITLNVAIKEKSPIEMHDATLSIAADVAAIALMNTSLYNQVAALLPVEMRHGCPRS